MGTSRVPAPATRAADAGAASESPLFDRRAIDFLSELALNNDRAWFQPRKAEYERLLRDPLAELCQRLAGEFATRGIPLAADAARSPFRIYRDVRFSRDKTPYKTHVSASFPWAGGALGAADPGPAERGAGPLAGPGEGSPGRDWPSGEGRTGVGAYFHFQPGEMFVGGGMWHPDPRRLAAWRTLLTQEPERVHAAIDDPGFLAEFGGVEGDRLKRVPAGFRPDDPQADLLRLKDVTFGRRLADDDVLSPRLPAILADALGRAVPVIRLLASLPMSEA